MGGYRLEKSCLYENYQEDECSFGRRGKYKKNCNSSLSSSITNGRSTYVPSRKVRFDSAYQYIPSKNYFVTKLSDTVSQSTEESSMFSNYENSNSIIQNDLNNEYTPRCFCYNGFEEAGELKQQINPRKYGVKTPLKDSHFIKRVLPVNYHYILYKSKFLPKVPCLACAAMEYENVDFGQNEFDQDFNEYPHLSLKDVSMEDIENNGVMCIEDYNGQNNSFASGSRKPTLLSRIGSTLKESANKNIASIKQSIHSENNNAICDDGDELVLRNSSNISASRSPSRTRLSTIASINKTEELSRVSSRSPSRARLPAVSGTTALKELPRASSRSPSRATKVPALDNSNELAVNGGSRSSSRGRLATLGSDIKSLVSRISSRSSSKNNLQPIENSKEVASNDRSLSKLGSNDQSLSRLASNASMGVSRKSALKPSIKTVPALDRNKSHPNKLDDSMPLYIENNSGTNAISDKNTSDNERQSSIFSLNATIPGQACTTGDIVSSTGSKSMDLRTKSTSLSRANSTKSGMNGSFKSVAKLEEGDLKNGLPSFTQSNSVSDNKLKELTGRKVSFNRDKIGVSSKTSPSSSHSGGQSIRSLHTDSEVPDNSTKRSITNKSGNKAISNSHNSIKALDEGEKFSLQDDLAFKAIENYDPDKSKSLSPSIFAFKEDLKLDGSPSNAIEDKNNKLSRFTSMPPSSTVKSPTSNLNKTLPTRLPSFRGKPLGSMKSDSNNSPLISPRPHSTTSVNNAPSSVFTRRPSKSKSDLSKSVTLKKGSISGAASPASTKVVKAAPKAKPPSVAKQNPDKSDNKSKIPDTGNAYCSSLTSNCHYMAVGTDLGFLLIWDLIGHNTNSKFISEYWDEASETPTAGVLAHKGKILSMDIKTVALVTGSEECMVITLGEDLCIRMWILVKNKIRLLTVDEFDLNKPVSVIFGKGMAMANDVMIGYQDGFIELWNSMAISCLETLVPSGIPLSTKPKPNDKSVSLRSKIKKSTHTYENLVVLSISHKGSYFALGGDTGMVTLYSIDKEVVLLGQFPCRNRRGRYSNGMPVTGIQWSEDEKNLCVTTKDNRIRVFFVRKGLGLEFAEKLKGFTLPVENEYARFAGTNNDLILCLSKDVMGSIKLVVWSRAVTDVMDLPAVKPNKYPTNTNYKQFLIPMEATVPRFEICQMGSWKHLEETVGEILPLSKVSGNFCLKLKHISKDKNKENDVSCDEVNDSTNNLLCILSTGAAFFKSIVISPIDLT